MYLNLLLWWGIKDWNERNEIFKEVLKVVYLFVFVERWGVKWCGFYINISL